MKINKAKIREFLAEKNLQIEKKVETFIFKETKKRISGKSGMIRIF